MPKLLIDLDRTLFDTPLFVKTIWEWIGQTYDIDMVAARENMQAYFTYVESMYSYDFFAHIAELGIDNADLIQRAHTDFSEITFLYDDVADFLAMTSDLDRAILTFGEATYQQLKSMLCPELNEIAILNTMRPKREYIEANYPGQEVILIDDKLQADELPANTRFIHLNREQEAPVINHATYVSINSLKHITKEQLL